MQKMLMLPHMPGVKAAIFTKRIIMFHETFAPLGGKKIANTKPVGVIWHEGISGRKDEDVTRAYVKFITSANHRDCKSILIWADNCSAQNKIGRFLLQCVN